MLSYTDEDKHIHMYLSCVHNSIITFDNGNKTESKEAVDGEKKRKLLPVLNPETGKMEDRYAEVIQREMNDEDDESSEEEENLNLEDELDGPLTEQEIRKIRITQKYSDDSF